MSASKVLHINQNVKLDASHAEKASNIVWWKRFLVVLGLMKKTPEEPSINAAALLFAILFTLSITLWFFKSTVLFALFIDKEMQTEALDVTATRRIEDKYNKEQVRNAKIMEHFKNGGTWANLPEELKVSESSESDRNQLHKENK